MSIIEPDGIVNACTTSDRMTSASSTAMAIASAYSRTIDFRRRFGSTASDGSAGWASISIFLSSMGQLLSTERNASCGTSTFPTCFIRFFPSFWRSSSFRFRVMSPP